MHRLETVAQLRKENQTLQHELVDALAALEAAKTQALEAQHAAREAWSFARVALKTGRGDRTRQA